MLAEWELGSVRDLANADARLDLFVRSRDIDLDRVRHGLAPFLVAEGDRHLVWGFAALRSLESHRSDDRVPVRIVAGGPRQELLSALRAEARRDAYSWRERAAIVVWAEENGLSIDDEIAAVLSTEGNVRSAVERFRRLPAPVADAIDSGLVDLRTGELCAPRDGVAIETLMGAMASYSFSRRNRVLRWFAEYAAGNNLDRGAERSRAGEVVAAEDPETAMRALRYPTLVSLDTTVRAFRDRYCRGTGVSIEPPPSYEGDAFRASFSFRTPEEYAARVQALDRAGEGVGEILGVLF